MSRCIPTGAATITLGVDTHKDTHVGVALDGLGRLQGTLSVAANPAGYKRLVEWASEFGHLEHAGVEGTGSFGAGLARFLKAQEIKVFEVIRPKTTGSSPPCPRATPQFRLLDKHRSITSAWNSNSRKSARQKFTTLQLRLENAHAAVEAAVVEARRRVRLNEEPGQ